MAIVPRSSYPLVSSSPKLADDPLTTMPLPGGQPPLTPKQAQAAKQQYVNALPAPLPIPGTAPSGGGAGGGGVPTSPAGPTIPGQIPSQQGPSNPMDDALSQAIMGLLGTKRGVDADSLYASPQFRAYRLGSQRSEERQRAQLAERSAATGMDDSGGFETGLSRLREQRGAGEAGYLGQLATEELTRQREELTLGIQFAMARGQFDKAQALQRELAQLDAQVQREGIGSADRRFDLGLGFNYAELNANQNAQALAMLLSLLR